MTNTMKPEKMATDTITITLKLFAIYQEALGVSEKTLTLPVGSSPSDVLDHILTERPNLDKWRNLTRFGINLQFVEASAALQDGDELVFIPPVSGG
jgi:molybdopterin synthase sulfur carrier subunit